MIVYRVAQGKGWTKETHAQVSTWNARTDGSTQLTGLSSTLRAAVSDIASTQEDPTKSIGTGVHAIHDVYESKERSSDVDGQV